jgi:2'-5' RNA ligase
VRLFVAADISDNTRAALQRVQASIAASVATATVLPRITWVQPSAAHITLRFIGEVDDETTRAATAALAAPLDLAPFEVAWVDIGVFPPGRAGLRAPRTIWMGAAAGGEALGTLSSVIDARLEPVVGAAEARPYSPHLTVGRVRLPGRGVSWAAVLEAARPDVTRSFVDRVTLYASRLSSRGPTYTAIGQAALSRRTG